MKTLKRIALAGTLALAVVTIANVDTANAKKVEKPFNKYGDCVDVCVAQYGAWTLRRSLCAADCYLDLLEDVGRRVLPFV